MKKIYNLSLYDLAGSLKSLVSKLTVILKEHPKAEVKVATKIEPFGDFESYQVVQIQYDEKE